MVGNSSLHQMTGAVHLMPIAEILPSHPRISHREVCIQISICLLGMDNFVSHLIEDRLQSRIRVCCYLLACGLHQFGGILIAKYQNDRCRKDAVEIQVKGANPICLYTLTINVRNCHRMIGFQPGCPKLIFKLNSSVGDWLELTFYVFHNSPSKFKLLTATY